jgi:hypothetical protein
MRRNAGLFGAVLTALLSGGCVERAFVVESNPPGAFVWVNNQPLTATPADGTWVYYGKYHFTLEKEGYETLHVEQEIDPPWYAYFPLDFFFESIWPCKLEDRRRFRYDLVPLRVPNTEDVLRRAEDLRNHGRSLRPEGEAPAPPPAEPEPAPPMPPAPQ